MEHSTKKSRDSLSYSNLFNLESLMNFRVPQPDDDFDYYGNSSQDESRSSQGLGMANHSNGSLSRRKSSLAKRKRWFYGSEEDEEDGVCGAYITEERYRSMLGEHVQKYRRRLKDSQVSTMPQRKGTIATKSNLGNSRARKKGTEHRGRFGNVEDMAEPVVDISPRRLGIYNNIELTSKVRYEPPYLDVGDGVTYRIPLSYEKLAPSLCLPSFTDVKVEEYYLEGALDLGSLAEMVASDKQVESRNWRGMGEPLPQYESLQSRLKALSASKTGPQFSLKVSEEGLNASIPEGAAGSIARSILSEGGVLHVYYVKVLEKGDTYEIIERSLPKKQKDKNDPYAIERTQVEKIAKVWANLVRKEVPKHHKNFTTFHRRRLSDLKRYADSCQKEVKLKINRSDKLQRGAPIRSRKFTRDMQLFWKRRDKELAEIKKKEEKEAAEALKREQELREAKRQQQRLNFLIQQTELYSHFMQNKTISQPSEILPTGDEQVNGQDVLLSAPDVRNDEEDPEEAEMKRQALKAAQDAVSKQRRLTNAFDTECSRLRETAEIENSINDAPVAGSSDIDLHNPSTMPVTSTVQTPDLFKGSLKEYQLKGLQWLVNCYEQGLNGILADEMGLGKTIQAMAFLAHLAEEKNIWGPFLVVAPASVLNNWADEISRFCPDLKTLPYWGGLQERMILRKNINPKRLYRRDAGFHILITSYQLLVSDEKYFRRVKWQYMVLDEAQAIKSSNSIRWKTLLSFNCRNRLLLTGTPIQNNMAELWALLHFIMPTLFDSHEQFNEWFSKGIENHAEHGGTLNEHQLNRLHAILKPFMLRRVKKDVISELTRKTEVTVHCKLSSRQQAFYQAIKNKISLAELFDGSRGHLNEKKILNLMNIVIQLRKVCNHPELFERNEGSTYFYFGAIPNSLLPPPFGELEDVHYSGGHNPITYEVPKLVHEEVLRSSEMLCSSGCCGLSRETFLRRFNIFSPDYIHQSIIPLERSSDVLASKSGAFGFLRLMDLSPPEVVFLATCSIFERLLYSVSKDEQRFFYGAFDPYKENLCDNTDGDYLEKEKIRAVTRMLLMPSRSRSAMLKRKLAIGPSDSPFEALISSHQDRLLSNIELLKSSHAFIPVARAPPVNAHCSDRNFAFRMTEELHHPWTKRFLIGFARTSEHNGPSKPKGPPHHLIQEIDSKLPVAQPALHLSYRIFGSCPPMRSFDPAKLLTDSGKLQTLDILLKRLRAENHRVLLFAQMTKMLNILEDYMNYRKYKYLRLDGSSTIMDRRDMVRDFQHRGDIFVFLLSTRAGGLGINLTAADTVIFYESDWNPTLDLQAMDRAHRLGQTKDVTVYRLICKETVEEKILQRASQKNTVQQLVMTGGHVQGDLLAPEDVVSLLLDDTQLEQKLKEVPAQGKERQKKKQPTRGIRLNAEGDASLEDITEPVVQVNTLEPSANGAKSGNKKKRIAPENKQAVPRVRNTQKTKDTEIEPVLEDTLLNADPQNPKSKRYKRQKKSINESLELTSAFISAPTSEQSSEHQALHHFASGS